MGLHLIESVEQQDGPQGTRGLWIEESILEHLRWQDHGQYPPLFPLPSPLDIRQGPLLVTSSGHHWRSVQTCSFDLTVRAYLPQQMHLVAVEGVTVSTSRRYASYWNAF